VAEKGSHEDLMKIEGGVYNSLWKAQLHDGTETTVEAAPEGEPAVVPK
jgi:hypothetical protein